MTGKETQFSTVVVPLDGSDFAAQALPVAVALATASKRRSSSRRVAHDEGQLAWVHRHVGMSCRCPPGRVDGGARSRCDPRSRSGQGAPRSGGRRQQGPCFASHDYGRVAAKVMHSVGSAIARAPHPVVVAGAHAAPSSWATDVVVAVDGVNDPSRCWPPRAAGRRMQAPLRIVTVYEPVPADLNRPTHFTRHHGPPGDPDEYLEAIQRHADQQVWRRRRLRPSPTRLAWRAGSWSTSPADPLAS